MPADMARPELGAKMLKQKGWEGYAKSYSQLRADWQVKGKNWKSTAQQRFQSLLEDIASRPETSFAVVAHHDFYHAYLNVSFDFAEARRYILDGERLLLPDGTPAKVVDQSPKGGRRGSVTKKTKADFDLERKQERVRMEEGPYTVALMELEGLASLLQAEEGEDEN